MSVVGRPSCNLSLDDIAPLFHMTSHKAASSLGLCKSTLKKLCRKHGISRWPYQKKEKKVNNGEVDSDPSPETQHRSAAFPLSGTHRHSENKPSLVSSHSPAKAAMRKSESPSPSQSSSNSSWESAGWPNESPFPLSASAATFQAPCPSITPSQLVSPGASACPPSGAPSTHQVACPKTIPVHPLALFPGQPSGSHSVLVAQHYQSTLLDQPSCAATAPSPLGAQSGESMCLPGVTPALSQVSYPLLNRRSPPRQPLGSQSVLVNRYHQSPSPAQSVCPPGPCVSKFQPPNLPCASSSGQYSLSSPVHRPGQLPSPPHVSGRLPCPSELPPTKLPSPPETSSALSLSASYSRASCIPVLGPGVSSCPSNIRVMPSSALAVRASPTAFVVPRGWKYLTQPVVSGVVACLCSCIQRPHVMADCESVRA